MEKNFPHLIASKIILIHKNIQISTLKNIQKLKTKNLKNFIFKFENDERNKNELNIKNLHNTHTKHITTDRESTTKYR